jgi:hypothetical protein
MFCFLFTSINEDRSVLVWKISSSVTTSSSKHFTSSSVVFTFSPECSFSKWIWKHLNEIFESHIKDETAVESKQLTKFHKGVVSLISKDRYKSMVGEMFSINEASGSHFRAAYGNLEELRKLLMMNKTEDVIRKSREKASRDGGRSFKTSEAGKAKVRYIAGWCMASLKHHKKSYVKRNLYIPSL